MRKTACKLLFVSVVLLSAYLPAMKATAAVTQSSLETVRDRLRANGCDRFIIVQAFMDGLLKENEPYELAYTVNNVTINKVQLAEPFRTAYISMIKTFFVEHPVYGNSNVGFYKVTSDETTLSAARILEPAYAAATCPCTKTEKSVTIVNKQPKHTDEPAKKTEATADRKIIYSADGITVNGRKLSASEERQYKQLYFNNVTDVPQGKETRVVTETKR